MMPGEILVTWFNGRFGSDVDSSLDDGGIW